MDIVNNRALISIASRRSRSRHGRPSCWSFAAPERSVLFLGRRFGFGLDLLFEIGEPRFPGRQFSLERFMMMVRTFGRELELINLVEEPDQLLELVGSEHFHESGLGRQLLGGLGSPGCPELIGQTSRIEWESATSRPRGVVSGGLWLERSSPARRARMRRSLLQHEPDEE